MKLLLLPIFLFFVQNPGENYFKVDTVNEVNSWMESLVPDNEPPYYKIRLSGDDSELGMMVYPPYSENEFSNADIEKMIAELLTYKGDTRKCFMKINCSGKTIYNGNLTYYSLQVEALYIINSIFFDSYSQYSPCPILTDESGKNLATMDGEMVNKAFEAYEKWFVEIKAMGIGNARAAQVNPLKGSGVKWYK
jgi:hypothetical protein